MSSPTPTYDVFVSYSHADEAWVWNWLVPRLKAAGLAVCTDLESFDVGVPSLINMERAVAASRHTLLVLSPSFLASRWTAYEALLTLQEDPIGMMQRTTPVLHEPCQPPPRLASLTYADLTRPLNLDAEFARLLDALRGVRRLPEAPAPAPTPAAPGPAGPPAAADPKSSFSIGVLNAVNVAMRDMVVDQRGATFGPSGVTGSGAIAQGEGAVAAGAGGVAIGGNVLGNVIITGGGDFVGRDKHVGGDEVRGDKVGSDRGAVGDVGKGVSAEEPRGPLIEEAVRLDVSAPSAALLDEPFDVAVAVQQPGAPLLALEGLTEVTSSDGSIFYREEDEVVRYRIELTGAGCEVAPPHYILKLRPLTNSRPCFFQVTAHRPGKRVLLVNAYQEDEALAAQTRVRIEIEVPIKEDEKASKEPKTKKEGEAEEGIPRMAKLTGQQAKQLQEAILSAFDRDELELLLLPLDQSLDRIAPPSAALGTVVLDVIKAAEREGWTAKLLGAIATALPNRKDLQALVAKLLTAMGA